MKQTTDRSNKSELFPAEKLNLRANFLDHKKLPFWFLNVLKAVLRSDGFEMKGVALFTNERNTFFTLGWDLQEQVLIMTTER